MNDLFDEQTLEQKINSNRELLEKRKDPSIIIPKYILENIKYDLYEWQEEAFKNFLIYNSDYREENTTTHLMFNMATGSGKTLLMASLILYYYKQGYKHFLFFVNQNNIVDKTKNNFLDYTHKKYLFNKNIIIDDKPIEIKEVDIFSDNPNSIEIKFTSIQKLHNNMREIRENVNTLEDFNKIGSYYDEGRNNSKGMIMLADEGHHFNSLTKKINNDLFDGDFELAEKTSQELIEAAWEYTVVNLLLQKEKFQYKNNNVLLEFTATIPENRNVLEKYKNKIIYKFPLLNFMRKGYTKEINLVSTQQSKKERILFALLFNWYRHKLAITNKIPNFKPVILFRSKTIEESKSDYVFFIDMISKLNKNDFKFIDDLNHKINVNTTKSYYDDITTKTEILIRFINDKRIDYQEIIDFIKTNFEDKNIIITNSKNNNNKNKEVIDSEIDTLLNNLEDKNNIIRGIFTVNRLTEGWDVLNLFDIVRLPEGQNAGGTNKKTAKATVEEAQLIGRGVRYYPFKHDDKNIYKRKFDDNLGHELRMLEELNYYTYDKDSRYITDLKNQLKKTGLLDSNKEKREFYIRDDIKATPFYKNTKIFYNKRKENPNRIKKSFEEATKECSSFQYIIPSNNVNEIEIVKDHDNKLETSYYKDSIPIPCFIKDYPKNIFYKVFHSKASRDNSLFSFSRLKNEVAIKSIKELLDDNFLGKCEIKFISHDVNNLEGISNEHKLKALSIFLDKLFAIVENNIIEKVGTEFSEKNTASFEDIFGDKKEKLVESGSNKKLVEDKGWFMLNDFTATSEEEALFEFIKNQIGSLKDKYDEIYLLKNEEVYKIYSFKDGRGFQPDYLLFLKKKDKELYFQCFIEAKGIHLIEHDKWKNEFLEEISNRYGNIIFTLQNKDYRLIALPLYNKDYDEIPFETFNNFKDEFKKTIIDTL